MKIMNNSEVYFFKFELDFHRYNKFIYSYVKIHKIVIHTIVKWSYNVSPLYQYKLITKSVMTNDNIVYNIRFLM